MNVNNLGLCDVTNAPRQVENGRHEPLVTALAEPPLAELDRLLPALDDGIRAAVRVLRTAGVETFESCEGGSDHAYPVPTVRFHGNAGAGWQARAALVQAHLRIGALRRT